MFTLATKVTKELISICDHFLFPVRMNEQSCRVLLKGRSHAIHTGSCRSVNFSTRFTWDGLMIMINVLTKWPRISFNIAVSTVRATWTSGLRHCVHISASVCFNCWGNWPEIISFTSPHSSGALCFPPSTRRNHKLSDSRTQTRTCRCQALSARRKASGREQTPCEWFRQTLLCDEHIKSLLVSNHRLTGAF